MTNTLITHIQLFFIGFTLSIAGPCLLTCTPVIVTYVAAGGKKFRESLKDISVFLAGRLFAYLLLGALAGFSGFLLRSFTGSGLSFYLKIAAGLISVIFGIYLFINKKKEQRTCKAGPGNIYSLGSLAMFGFILGISPCVPLTTLLFEITLISKSVLEAVLYTLSFGLGTLAAGFIVTGSLAGVAGWTGAKILKSERGRSIFKTLCAALLILFGISIIIF